LTLSSNASDLNASTAKSPPNNYRLFFLYAAPYFAYVALGSLESLLTLTWVYTLRLLIVPGILIWAWRWYKPLGGPKNFLISIASGILVGIFGTVLWISLITPFVEGGASPWENPAFSLRLAAATFIVPVFEELFMRGYIFYFVLQWDQARKRGTPCAFDDTLHDATIDEVKAVCWNLPAIIISTIAFSLGHQVAEWPAAVAYGVLMAFLLVLRKDLLSCVVAHGITNLCLGIFVVQSGNWQYW
jgi:uncharacterized protein